MTSFSLSARVRPARRPCAKHSHQPCDMPAPCLPATSVLSPRAACVIRQEKHVKETMTAPVMVFLPPPGPPSPHLACALLLPALPKTKGSIGSMCTEILFTAFACTSSLLELDIDFLVS